MEDADQPVGQRAESLVMCLTASTVGVVVTPSTWRASQRRVRPAEACVDQMAVARHTREHGVACATGTRDRSGPSVSFACLRIAVASWIITKLGQRSGTKHQSQTWQARDDLTKLGGLGGFEMTTRLRSDGPVGTMRTIHDRQLCD